MAGFWQSSQWTHWTFSAAELDDGARVGEQGGDIAGDGAHPAKRPRSASGDAGAHASGAAKRPRPAAPGGPSGTPGAADARAPLTPADEQRLLRYYELDIQRVCRDAPFDTAVMATAVAFFKRYFVVRAVVDMPPSEIVDAALFLAVKTEACPYTEVGPFRARLARFRGVPESDLVTHEVTLLSALKYQLAVFHPYRPLKALLTECIRDSVGGVGGVTPPAVVATPPPPAADDPALRPCWDGLQARCMAAADLALTTDAPLCFAPAVVAAGCLLWSARPPPPPPPAAAAGAAAAAAPAAADAVPAPRAGASAASAAAFTAALRAAPAHAVAAFATAWVRARLPAVVAASAVPSTPPPAVGVAASAAASAATAAAALVRDAEAVAAMLDDAALGDGVGGAGRGTTSAAPGATNDASALEARLFAALRAAADASALDSEREAFELMAARQARLAAQRGGAAAVTGASPL